MDDLIGEFIGETSQSLAALERVLGDAARIPMTNDDWDMAVKLMHTITGTCGFLHLPALEALAERTKGLLEGLRDSAAPPSAEQTGQLHGAMAQISVMMKHLAEHGGELPRPAAGATASAPASAPASAKRQPFTLPPPPPVAPPLAIRPLQDEKSGPLTERVTFATMATLVTLRNQMRDMLRLRADSRLNAAETTLAGLIESLRDKILPRAREIFPRLDRVLLVYSAGMRMAVLESNILGTARIGEGERHGDIEEGALLSLRGQWLPRLSLARRMGKMERVNEAYAVMIQQRGIRVALCVEQLGTLEELVVQEVPSLLRKIRIYEGAVILGDGTPCLLLDVAALLEEDIAPSQQTSSPQSLAPKAAPQPFLLFSDGTDTPKAIPLTQVARVEHTSAGEVQNIAGNYTAKVRGELLNLRLLPGSTIPTQGDLPLILLLDTPHTALLTHRIGGIVDAAVDLPHPPGNDLILAKAVLDGTPTSIINAKALNPGGQEVAHG
jgi:chemotaxis protein histidine kinase CheA